MTDLRHPDPALNTLIHAYEQLRPDTLPALCALYHPQARFKDPFNEVQGEAAFTRIFSHMFEVLESPRFVVLEALREGPQALLTWTFHFGLRGRQLVIRGATHLRFDEAQRITDHRDYWDAAEELYSQLPVLGALMRWLQKQLRTPQA